MFYFLHLLNKHDTKSESLEVAGCPVFCLNCELNSQAPRGSSVCAKLG